MEDWAATERQLIDGFSRFSPTNSRVAEIDIQLSTIVGSAGFMAELPTTREATRGAWDPCA